MRDAIRDNKAPVAHQTWGSFSVNDTSASTPVFFKFSADDIVRDEAVRDALETADSSVDPEVRKQGYRKALTRISEEAFALPLYSVPMNYAFVKELSFTPHPDELPRFYEAKWK
jgi:peptide/nickel transport system substrate-binding protein